MAMARSPWLNCGATITPSKHQLLHRYPAPSFRPSRAYVQSGFDQNIRGRQRKVSLQVSHSRLFEVLALQAPTKYELVVNLKTAEMLGLDLPAAPLARSDEVIDKKAQFAATHESAYGTERTCQLHCAMSAFRGRAENICSH